MRAGFIVVDFPGVALRSIGANLFCYDIFGPGSSFSVGTPPDRQRFRSNGLGRKKGKAGVRPVVARVARRRTHASDWTSGVLLS